jgi:hypothetical protein
MSSQRNPLTDSIDELLCRQGYDMPLIRYLFTRDGLRDWAIGTSLACLCFVAAYLIVVG